MSKVKKTFLFLIIILFSNSCAWNNHYSAKNVFSDPQVAQLAQAAAEGDTQRIDKLLALGVNIDAVGKDNLTPAYWTFAYVSPSKKSKKGFEHLIKKGADSMHIHAPSKHPLLHMTARGDDSDYLNIILKYSKNYDLNGQIENETWSTPILTAMLARRFDNFKSLISYGADIEQVNSYGEKPITLMTKPGTWLYALYLLEQGADYNVGNEKNEGNPDGMSEIVWSLENMNYWDHLYPDPSGEPSDREKVINFLQNKGVKVYPYHRKDDPRYQLRPKKNHASFYPTPFPFEKEKKAHDEKDVTFYYEENYQTALGNLESLKKAVTSADINTVLKLIHEEGIYIYKSDENKTVFYSQELVKEQLAKKDSAFVNIFTDFVYENTPKFHEHHQTEYGLSEWGGYFLVKIGSSYGFLFRNNINAEIPKLLRIEIY